MSVKNLVNCYEASQVSRICRNLHRISWAVGGWDFRWNSVKTSNFTCFNRLSCLINILRFRQVGILIFLQLINKWCHESRRWFANNAANTAFLLKCTSWNHQKKSLPNMLIFENIIIKFFHHQKYYLFEYLYGSLK